MKVTGVNVQCRVRIAGTLNGQPWEFTDPEDCEGSQFISALDAEGNQDPSEWWWSQGNMACDCNRVAFLSDALASTLPRGADNDVLCGHQICIDSIVPVERGPNGEELPSLHLNESTASE